MHSSISNTDKKSFLKWITKNYVMKRREALWILDYLYNHDIILEKTHFVENGKETPRGISMAVAGNERESFLFYKNGHIFKDAMQAFHEVRLNWSSPLYIEILIDNPWQHPEYLAVLEDNPYAKWNDTISLEMTREIEEALNYEGLLYAKEQVLKEIDQSLVAGKKNEFALLTDELFEINRRISDLILSE